MRAGDEGAFRVFVGRYHQAMIRVAARYVPSPAIAEEVVQETWMGVIRGLGRFEGRSSVKTWLFRIVENQARTRGAREPRATPFSALASDGEGGEPAVDPARFVGRGDPFAGYWATPPARFSDLPEQRLLSGETREAIEQAIAALPDRQQQVISLRDIEGWHAEEVCEFLGLSEGNQRVLLHRARARVRAALEAHFARLAAL
jgi:RNA polymerase sigma-70 factor (ECF subfamily)